VTNIFMDKRGKISVVKTSLFFTGLGLLIVLASFLYVTFETDAARSPLDIPLPENAESWSSLEFGDRPIQRVFYRVPTTDVESVVAHYQEQASQFGAEACRRFPPSGDYPGYDPDEGNIQFEWKCLFERSNLPSVAQSTLVIIQPGVPNEDPFLNAEGYTVIEYEQRWHQ